MADDDSKVMTKGVFRSFVTDWYRKLKGAFNVEGTLTATKSDGTKAWELSQESAVLGTTEPAVKGMSQIGTAGNPFGAVWADNLNNNPITDTNNQTLSVSGATSIVGALNQINSHLNTNTKPRGTVELNKEFDIAVDGQSHSYELNDPIPAGVKFVYFDLWPSTYYYLAVSKIVPAELFLITPIVGWFIPSETNDYLSRVSISRDTMKVQCTSSGKPVDHLRVYWVW